MQGMFMIQSMVIVLNHFICWYPRLNKTKLQKKKVYSKVMNRYLPVIVKSSVPNGILMKEVWYWMT